MKRDRRVVNRYCILLLLACFFVAPATRLAAKDSPDGKDENKTKDERQS